MRRLNCSPSLPRQHCFPPPLRLPRTRKGASRETKRCQRSFPRERTQAIQSFHSLDLSHTMERFRGTHADVPFDTPRQLSAIDAIRRNPLPLSLWHSFRPIHWSRVPLTSFADAILVLLKNGGTTISLPGLRGSLSLVLVESLHHPDTHILQRRRSALGS